jgi:hypothetical protein
MPRFFWQGLGVFHGPNPAMGWLVTVALGLHSDSRADVSNVRCWHLADIQFAEPDVSF